MDKEFIDENTLAERWKLTKKTLRVWRMQGKGPKYIKIGKLIRYPMADILEYEDKNTRKPNKDD